MDAQQFHDTPYGYGIPHGNFMVADEPVNCHYEKHGHCEFEYICGVTNDCVRGYKEETIELLDYCISHEIKPVYEMHLLPDEHFDNYCYEKEII